MPEEIIPHNRSDRAATRQRRLPRPSIFATSEKFANSSRLVRLLEFLSQSLPDLETLMVELCALQRKFRRLAYESSLEHKRHRVLHVDWLQISLARLLKRFRVRPMTRHAIVQAGATGHKSFCLGVVFASNEPHEFIHEVAMKPGWTKRMLGNHPSRRKYDKVNICCPRNFRRRSQHRVNRRIRMIKAHRVNAIEIRQIIFIRHIISVPPNDIQRRVINRCCPQSSLELSHNPVIALLIFKGRNWSQKIPRIGQPVRTNRPEVGETK